MLCFKLSIVSLMILKEGNAKSVEVKKKFSSMSLKYVSYEILANKNVNKSTKPEKELSKKKHG